METSRQEFIAGIVITIGMIVLSDVMKRWFSNPLSIGISTLIILTASYWCFPRWPFGFLKWMLVAIPLGMLSYCILTL